MKTKNTRNTFKKPFVKNSNNYDTTFNVSANFINAILPDIIGKYHFSDTIELINQMASQKYWKDCLKDNQVGMTDSTLTDGLELFVDYKTNIHSDNYSRYITNCYPVYLINQTPNIKALLVKDNHVFGLQEALDSSGHWRPIEVRGYDFCGWGYVGLKILPREFVAILFPKYKGNYKTKLRIRLKNKDNIYVSLPFEGLINYNQFYLEKDSNKYNELIDYPSYTILGSFYGSLPFQTDERNGGPLTHERLK